MVVRKDKKSRSKVKGHGYGHGKKHRGAGNKGGRGRAGSKKGKKIGENKYDKIITPKGFSGRSAKVSSINVGQLSEIASASKKTGFDLQEIGISKLLGGGKVDLKLKVKVKSLTKLAREKILNAGGEILE